MYQGTGEITSLYRGIVKPGFRSIHFTVTGIGRAEKCYSLYREHRVIEDRYIGAPLEDLIIAPWFSNFSPCIIIISQVVRGIWKLFQRVIFQYCPKYHEPRKANQ